LFKLHGTIATWTQGSKYHTPIIFWFQENFPQSAPIAYVEATSGLKIAKDHKEVSSSGMIWNDYCKTWETRRGNGVTLVQMIQNLASSFGQRPPLYAAGNSFQQPQQYQSNSWQARPAGQVGGGISGFMGNVGNMFGGGGNQQQQPAPPSYEERKPSPPKIDPKVKLRADVTKKLAKKVEKHYDAITASCTELSKKQAKFLQNKGKAERAMGKLDEEEKALTERQANLEKTRGEVTTWLDANEGGEIDASQVLSPVDTHSEQIIEATATIKAYDDTIYALKQAKEYETITLEVFMKETRKLARKQFYDKALIELIKDVQMKHGGRSPNVSPNMAAQPPGRAPPQYNMGAPMRPVAYGQPGRY